MLTWILLFASNHRDTIICVIGFSLWIAAYAWYGVRDWERYKFQRRTRKWSVDMVTKSSKGGYGER